MCAECSQDDQRHNGQEVWCFLACSGGRGLWLWDHTWSEEPPLHVLWWKSGYLCVEMLLMWTENAVSIFISLSFLPWEMLLLFFKQVDQTLWMAEFDCDMMLHQNSYCCCFFLSGTSYCFLFILCMFVNLVSFTFRFFVQHHVLARLPHTAFCS